MEDDRIVDLYWQRDPDAITQTSQKYGTYCHAIALRILHDQQDAEECTNDTWLHAWEAMPPQRPGKLSAFLGRITRNLSLDRYDYRSAAKRCGAFDTLLSELSDCIPSGQDDYAQLELSELLTAFLRELPQRQRNVFLRRYWYCESVDELARRYAMTQSAIKSSLFRTRGKLKEYLAKEGVGIE